MRNELDHNLIGLMTGQNPNLLVAILGILKSGMGFVPIDPSYPIERIDFVIRDCGIKVLVTEEKYSDKATQISENNPSLEQVICIDRLDNKAGQDDDAKLYDDADYAAKDLARRELGAKPHQPAYVIYTSGSTGTPKGVPISHENLMPLLLWSEEYFDLGEHTRTLQNLSYCFDFGLFEILTTLLFGGTLYLLDKDEISNSSQYSQYIDDHAINTIHSTPSFFREVVGCGGKLETLETLHLGGEQLTKSAVEEIFKMIGEDCIIYNGYGPTEATINTTIFEVGSRLSRKYCEHIPIGKASANNLVYILDVNCNPAPIGFTGELHIGGIGLTYGYLNRSDLTAQKFIPNPFSNSPGERLYKTGDLVRHLPDGNIEFLGRIDHQIKVRGFRIELGEIETVLTAHPAVREAVVLAREDKSAGRRLVAYVTPNLEHPPKVGEMRTMLRERLPEYMVPSTFVMLDEMPLTPNGKIDRQGLPAPDRARPDLEEAFVAPRTATEEVVAEICVEVLGVEQVGVHDNFFDLGCHSLLATKIVARLRETFQVEFPLLNIFKSPTVASLSEGIEEASNTSLRPHLPRIQHAPRDVELPLSFAQERLWFLNELDPDNISYYVPRAVRLGGRLDKVALDRTFSELVRRHEILRTTFPAVDGKPVQVIHPPYRITIPVVDLQALPQAEREALVEQMIVEAGQQPFDLAQGPLMRLILLKLDEQDYILILIEHHMVHDGWTQGVLLHDFLTIYKAFTAGRPSPLPDLPIQYADFAYWQRQWLRGEVLESLLSYWKKQLSDAPPFLELPTDYSRPAIQSSRGAVEYFELPDSLAESLRAMSRRERVTLFMTMLAAFKLLLYRYTNQQDLVVGTGIANRGSSEIEGLLGMIINTVVLRTQLSDDFTFRELLKRIREVCLGAYSHQEVPFEKLVEALKPPRNLSFTPLFQVMFSFLDTPMPDIDLPELDLNIINAHNRSAKFDLDVLAILHGEQRIGLSSEPWDERITMMWEYNTDLFDAGTIRRMHGHFQNLLEQIVVNPLRRLSEYALLTEGERDQLLIEWNNTKGDYPKDQTVSQLFEAQVERTPDAVALMDDHEQLTYRQLNRRANKLAHYLRSLGVGPETVVAIYMERSVETIVGLLGIVKAGGAYVPLDPTYPRERLEFIVEDAKVTVIVTHRHLTERLAHHGAQVVYLDPGWEAEFNEQNPISNSAAENLAYVIYTSGSTGRPKGVLITHGGICNRLQWGQNMFPLGEADCLLHLASLSFDVSVWEIFAPLIAGARLAVARPGGSHDSAYLVKLMTEHKVSVAGFVPSLLQVLLDDERIESCTSLRQVLAGAEPLRSEVQDRFLDHLDAELYNFYGPTEGTIDTTFYRCEAGNGHRVVPIGRPLANVRIYILDTRLEPVPIGVCGELYIAGAGLARGYLNQPAMTAEKFIPDPFSAEPGARMYRSGDLAGYLLDGSIKFIGREDHQVKIRGFRIELQEIEAAIAQHPAVKEAIVLAVEQKNGQLHAPQMGATVAGNIRLPMEGMAWRGRKRVERLLLDIERMKDKEVELAVERLSESV